jgi:hypothetical protein
MSLNRREFIILSATVAAGCTSGNGGAGSARRLKRRSTQDRSMVLHAMGFTNRFGIKGSF